MDELLTITNMKLTVILVKMFFSRLGVQEVNILRDIDFPLGGQILLSCIQIGDNIQELINKRNSL